VTALPLLDPAPRTRPTDTTPAAPDGPINAAATAPTNGSPPTATPLRAATATAATAMPAAATGTASTPGAAAIPRDRLGRPLVSAEALERAGSAEALAEMMAADARALAADRHGAGPRIALQPLRATDPLRWLAAGWRDFRRAPLLGLFYGSSFAAMGWTLLLLFRHAPAYVLALAAGFMLTGPFLALGLYHASRALERGQRPDLGQSVLAWTERTGQMAVFGLVLLVLEMLWARASLVVFALSFDGMPDFRGSVQALFNPANLEFIVAYLGVGGLFATLIFSVSVVALPMILDRQCDAITAGLTSLRLVLTQTGVMALWALLLATLVIGAMLPGFLGLLLVGPVVGHASWHAYRAAVAPPADEGAPAGGPSIPATGASPTPPHAD
jgi:uncharacterized membrane protein